MSERNTPKKALFCLFVIILLVGGLVYSCWPKAVENNISSPITREQAINNKQIHLEVPLPESAEEIYYYYNTPGIMAFTYLLRFKSTSEGCTAYAEKIMNREKGMGKYWDEKKINSDESLSVPVSWNKIDEIENGTRYSYNLCDLDVKKQRSTGLPTCYEEIFIDADKNIIYYFRGD